MGFTFGLSHYGKKWGVSNSRLEKQHNDDIHGCHYSPDLARVMISRRMRWLNMWQAWWRIKMHMEFVWKNYSNETVWIGGQIILKWLLKKENGLMWTGAIRLRVFTNFVFL